MQAEAWENLHEVANGSVEKSKKKRKHADDDKHKSSKKKRKHAPAEDDGVEKEETTTETPDQSQDVQNKTEKKSRKKKKEKSLPSPETSSTKPIPQTVNGDQVEALTLPAPETTSATPPPSQLDVKDGVEEAESSSSTSPFFSKRTSLLVPVPPISISTNTALSSLLAQHISPLLLTYHPPLKGIILSFSDPSLSSEQPSDNEAVSSNTSEADEEESAQSIPLAHSRDEHGVSFIWLTVTLLVFSPRPGDELSGYINIASEGFVGIVSYNYFQVTIGKERIPSTWRWTESASSISKPKAIKKTKIRDEDSSPRRDSRDEFDTDLDFETAPEDNIPSPTESGYFTIPPSQTKISGPIKYRVIDTELIPGTHADKWGLRIIGTLLSASEEEKLQESECIKWENREKRRKDGANNNNSTLPKKDLANEISQQRKRYADEPRDDGDDGDEDVVMTGALDLADGDVTTTPSMSIGGGAKGGRQRGRKI